jgi:choline dehydrogenase-like flavoprotein
MRDLGAYDYIIVGAGSAGCVLANRLTESGRHRVLLLEAGGADTNIWIHIPLGYGKLFIDPSVNWLYQTTPQAHLDNRQISQPRGKVLGGSSSINGLVYIRGQRQDFNHWRQCGATGWGYDDVLPYFIKAEDQARGANAFHGVGGPLKVSDLRRLHRRRSASRSPGQSGLQRRRAGGGRLLPDHLPQRRPYLRRRRVPKSRQAPAELTHRHRRARHQTQYREQPGDRA